LKRRVIAGLACRLSGTRLYAKPLQPITRGLSILEHIVACLRTEPFIDEIVLAIANEAESLPVVAVAERLGCPYVLGDAYDVLGRLIQAGTYAEATDLVRQTTECPFYELESLGRQWRRHVEDGNDVTVVDHVPLGTAVEIYSMDCLRRSHANGLPEDRSEYVSNYVRFNQRLFRVGYVEPPVACRRPDIRLTVDYAEDLVVCQAVYAELLDQAPRIPVGAAISFLDRRPDLKGLVAEHVSTEPTWDGVLQRS
jgi:spore coat polysaccharide biosynthesis protein SpsF